MLKIIKVASFLMLLTFCIGYLNISYLIDAPGKNEKPINIIVKKGYSIKRIGKELVLADLIKSPKLFILIKKFFFPGYMLHYGEFEIPAHASIRNIIEIFNKGEVVIHKFTIIEGMTTFEVISKINDEKILIGNINRNFKEGEFLADTYFFTYGESKSALIDRILVKTNLVFNELWEKRAENLPFKNLYEAITLASIIEKETCLKQEKPIIASVFINRLNKNMKLQADPTIIYGITKGEYVFNKAISLADLKHNSPYNTYLYQGLPLTPIANVGKEALKAALNPAKTNYLYFVADGKGGHNFSSTLNEHNINVYNYRKGVINNDK